MQAVEKREFNVKNLKPFKKGEDRARKSPGRPKTVDFAAAFREFASTPERQRALYQALLKKKPDIALAHLAGKPIDRLELSGPGAGPLQVHTTSQADLDRELLARGVKLPS